MLGDDVMVNFPNLRQIPRDLPWFEFGTKNLPCGPILNPISRKYCRKYDCDGGKESNGQVKRKCVVCDRPSDWWWRPIYEAWFPVYVKKLASSSDAIVEQCSRDIANKNGDISSMNQPNMGGSDIYYMPQKLAKNVTILIHLYVESGLNFEISIPTMCNCLGDHVRLRGVNDWKKATRNKPWLFYQKTVDKVYFHPYKLGLTAKSEKHREFFCQVIIPNQIHNINAVSKEETGQGELPYELIHV